MAYVPPRSLIERIATGLGLIPGDAQSDAPPSADQALARFPSAEQWSDHVEADPRQWPAERRDRRYRLVPTTCFNCESACGLLAYIDKETLEVRKLEGNPLHPGSRGKNCAKGPATINQLNDPDRILTPMRRVGARGEGKWEAVSWDDALKDIGRRIRKALQEKRHDEVVYHVGRPGAEGYVDRVLKAWGVDGHNSHTNICSSGARLGYALWSGYDRPMPDYANARFILALNAHLESGHYFNPHAQRISEGIKHGAKLAVVDPRLSNTASAAHHWLPTRPGSEAALLLAFARVILEEQLYDRAFLERWVNWRTYLRACHRDAPETFETFIECMKSEYAKFTPSFAEAECGVSAKQIEAVARAIGQAGSGFCSHTWRGAASAHLGGWQVSRCLFFLHVLTGSVGTVGGCSPSAWSKYKASLINPPPAFNQWNELHWPREFPLAHYEMSFLLPHFLKEGRGKIDTYFTRVFNPVWTYPDGFSWIEVLRDESLIGCHVALTPTWNETALFADYVLPMGHGPERHDLNTYETHSGTWIAFRQPVVRAALEAAGRTVHDTRDSNPGDVWEEDEFWIDLTWAIDPDGALGARQYFESVKQPGQKLTVDEYYEHLFDRVPGLPEAAGEKNLTPIEYMRRFGAFEVKRDSYRRYERKLTANELEGTEIDDNGVVRRNGARVGVAIDGEALEGFHSPSGLLEFYSPTMAEWGWGEYALPHYIPSHVAVDSAATARGEFCLLPTFRLPTLIHTRSGGAKWLNEISQRNPVWIHVSDAKRLDVQTGDLVRVATRIGHFIDRCWVTEAIRPGVIACSHHLGRWRRKQDPPNSRWSGNVVAIEEENANGGWTMRTVSGPTPFPSDDPDSGRIWWRDGGVPQNLTFPVHPDPISGMHCWHQQVTVTKAGPTDNAGDVFVDTNKSHAIYREWMERTRWPVGPGNLRRPLWLNRPLRPVDEAYRL